MTNHEREITKEVYDHAKANRGYITADDSDRVFTISELIGYGVYGDQVFERDGKYYVSYSLGSSCD